ncbi:MAG: hypothetical protein JXB05_00735 [Myxococcaceae bacterium]|nr:hypothetical protein [Myxococcaceae bacterium]
MQISFVSLARSVVLIWLLFWATLSLAQPGTSLRGRPAPEASGRIAERGATDAPLSAGAWVAHGTLTLLPVGSVYATSRLGDERLWATGAQAGAGMVAGWLPSRLLFLRPQASGPRWMELEVATFGVGLVLTPVMSALGTWGMGEAAFHGSRKPGAAFLGAMGGAAVGMLLGLATHGLLEWLVAPGAKLKWARQLIALGIIGAGASAGYQWAGGGPRPR